MQTADDLKARYWKIQDDMRVLHVDLAKHDATLFDQGVPVALHDQELLEMNAGLQVGRGAMAEYGPIKA